MDNVAIWRVFSILTVLASTIEPVVVRGATLAGHTTHYHYPWNSPTGELVLSQSWCWHRGMLRDRIFSDQERKTKNIFQQLKNLGNNCSCLIVVQWDKNSSNSDYDCHTTLQQLFFLIVKVKSNHKTFLWYRFTDNHITTFKRNKESYILCFHLPFAVYPRLCYG